MNAAEVKQRMPSSAELAAALRKDFGDEFMNEAIRNGLRLQREYLRMEAEQGTDRADDWLLRQNPSGPVASFKEGDLVLGMLPGRLSAEKRKARR